MGIVIVTDGRLTLSNGPGATGNPLAFAEISAVEPATLEQWRARFFAANNAPETAAVDADPDHDGLPNLLEYGFGLDPTQADLFPLVTPALTRTDGGDRFGCEFERNAHATDLVFTVQASEDLSVTEWSAVASYVAGAGWSGSARVYEAPPDGNRIKATVLEDRPMTAEARRYLRLQVARP